jgi:glycosyltransferase involved in cell wall biosynthesis
MRTGQNPAKFIDKVGRPERITVAVVTYIPFLAGYFAESLQVLQLCLDSLRRNTPEPFDLLVFDNGSAAEVVSYLETSHARNEIDFLVLSGTNLGKGGAWDFVFAGAPGEIIAYADGDVAFEAGWLARSLDLLETFPRVGMVSSRPLRTDPTLSGASLRWAETDPEATLERGTFISWEVFREHDVNLGQPEPEVRERYDGTQDVRLLYRGAQALVGAVHWQFVARKDVLRALLPLSLDRPMGQVRALDARLNDAGYLRLMTTEPLVRHMGNVVPPEQRAAMGLAPLKAATAGRRAYWLLEWPPVRRFLLAVHNRIFRWYFRS